MNSLTFGDGIGASLQLPDGLFASPWTKWVIAAIAVASFRKSPLTGVASLAFGTWLGWHACQTAPEAKGVFREALKSVPMTIGQQVAVDTNFQGWGDWGNFFGRYGVGPAGAEVVDSIDSAQSGAPGLTNTITALAPTISTLADALTDPRRQVEILKWKIAKTSNPTKRAKLEAKLRAAQARLGIKDESLESTREWRTLGKAGVLTGIALGGAVIFFILVKAMNGGGSHRAAAAA